jgi:hypothetical protein
MLDDDFARYAVDNEPPPGAADMILEFTASVKKLYSADVVAKHPNMWVAAYKGIIVADADETIVRDMLRQRGIPIPLTAMRFIRG